MIAKPFCCVIILCFFLTVSDQRVVRRVFVTQVKYKESGKKERSSSLYSTMADTLETSFAREVTDMQSEVSYV